MTKTDKNKNICVDSLEEGVCDILSGFIPEKEVKEYMPDLDEVMCIMKEDELLQSVFKGLFSGEIKNSCELVDVLKKELENFDCEEGVGL